MKKEILSLIAKDEIESALKTAIDYFYGNPNQMELILISSRFERIKKGNRIGILDNGQYHQELTKIAHSIILYVQENDNKSDEKSNTFSLYKLDDEDSVWGFPYLAINRDTRKIVNISDDFLVIEDLYDEINLYIISDYSNTGEVVKFDYERIQKIMNEKFGGFSFSATFRRGESLELCLFQNKLYQEIEIRKECEGDKKEIYQEFQIVCEKFLSEIKTEDKEDSSLLS
jgi:hypothetical protein